MQHIYWLRFVFKHNALENSNHRYKKKKKKYKLNRSKNMAAILHHMLQMKCR
jgi:hypothetical protein